MSGEKIPENLLLEIAYSKEHVLRREYTQGRLVSLGEYSEFPIRSIRGLSLRVREVSSLVIPTMAHTIDMERLLGRKCGITVDVAKTSASDTVIRVYALPTEMRIHRVHAEPSFHETDDWLRDFVKALDPIRVFTASEARGEDVTVDEEDKIVTEDSYEEVPIEEAERTRIEEAERNAHRAEFRRLEIRRLRAEVIKAEIEAAEAIRDSEFYGDAKYNAEKAAEEVREYLEDWA